MSSTDAAYGAMGCGVLSWRMVLPGVTIYVAADAAFNPDHEGAPAPPPLSLSLPFCLTTGLPLCLSVSLPPSLYSLSPSFPPSLNCS
eukprot:1694212-Rhodomonas_salina.6